MKIKIMAFLTQYDKCWHIMAGLIIGAIFALCFDGFWAFIPILPAAVAGFLKELFDKYVKRTFIDRGDILATLIGGAIIQIIVIVALII